MPRDAAQDEQVREHVDDVDRAQLPLHPDGQALAGELVDDVEHPVLAPVMRAVLDEVVGPDVVRALRPQPDARAVVEPEPAPLGLPPRHLEPLPPPDPLDPLAVHRPARIPQQGGDPAVAVAAVAGGERDDRGGQCRLVISCRQTFALRGAVLPENPARPPLGHAELGNHMLHAGAATGGAQEFPRAASARIILSSVRSETARRSRVFSASSSLRRLTWPPFSPPYSWRQR